MRYKSYVCVSIGFRFYQLTDNKLVTKRIPGQFLINNHWQL